MGKRDDNDKAKIHNSWDSKVQIELDFTSDPSPLGIKGLMGLNCLAVSEQDFKKFVSVLQHPQKRGSFPSAWTLTRFFWSLKLTEICRDRKKGCVLAAEQDATHFETLSMYSTLFINICKEK